MNEVQRTKQDFFSTLESLENIFTHNNNSYSQGGDYLLGEHFSLAECISAPWIQRFFVTLPYFRDIDFVHELQRTGRLSDWMKSVCARPSVIESKCPDSEMIAAAKRYYVSFITPGAKGTL